ncbi:MAG: guanylate kinase [Synergistales bacterium]|nr:guanylate kinase [Synergistales bacterium]
MKEYVNKYKMLNENKKGKLFVISGPSGAGKGTLREKALNDIKNLVYSISCTTRKPREGEVDGVQYRFITHEKFKEDIEKNLFLEYAHVHSDFYGTLKADVIRELNVGNNVLLEIDVQGALQVRKKIFDAVLIFIAPPSIEELEKRLRNRHTESEEALKIRLNNAAKELELKDGYDFIIINDDLERAAAELRKLIESQI